MVPTVNDVKLTGDDGENPWPRSQHDRWIPTGRAVCRSAGAGARRVDHARAGQEHAAAAAPRTIWRRFSGCCSPTVVCASCPTPSVEHLTAARPGSAAERARNAGQSRLRARLQPCHGGPRQSTTPFPIVRFHDILTECPRPPQNPLFAFKPCPERLARNVRTYEIELSAETPLLRMEGPAQARRSAGPVPIQVAP